MKNWNGLRSRSWASRVIGVLVGLLVVAMVAGVGPVSAAIKIDDGGDDGGGGGGDSGGDDGSTGSCLDNVHGSLEASPDNPISGQSTTLSWSSNAGTCATLKLVTASRREWPLNSSTGQVTNMPIFSSDGTEGYTLVAYRSLQSKPLASVTVAVWLPPTAKITSDNQVGDFLHAIDTPWQRIEIENHVNLDLSGREDLHIKPGVQIIGGRSPTEPGPRLFTTTFPEILFSIGGHFEGTEERRPADNVRISGIRLEGAEMGVADEHASLGIKVYSSVNVEIDNNELSGWSNAAVGVAELDHLDLINPDNYNAVWVHDNFIHHNQHRGRLGYGVVVGDTAYALIERNVFDWNRHAIAGDGSDGSGYRAYRNLVLKNGGYHDTYNACDIPWWLALLDPYAAAAKALCELGIGPSYTHYTHQFDMHGQDNCGISGTFSDAVYNCGTAGHDMDIRYNSFLYTKGNAIKLRGTPQLELGASVISNVFAHADLEDAVTQTETGLSLSGNLTGVNGMNELGMCDFDGDGIGDPFLATGQTWWYYGDGPGQWLYLNTSTKRRSQLTLGDFSGDGICDVKDDKGLVYLGGVTLDTSLRLVPNVKDLAVAQASSVLAAAGFTTGQVDYFYDSNCTYLGEVASQTPISGTYAPAGTAVNLRVGLKATACK